MQSWSVMAAGEEPIVRWRLAISGRPVQHELEVDRLEEWQMRR